jgi:hypothetical protein
MVAVSVEYRLIGRLEGAPTLQKPDPATSAVKTKRKKKAVK